MRILMQFLWFAFVNHNLVVTQGLFLGYWAEKGVVVRGIFLSYILDVIYTTLGSCPCCLSQEFNHQGAREANQPLGYTFTAVLNCMKLST